MTRKRSAYPPEAFVFEVVETWGCCGERVGDHVEVIPWFDSLHVFASVSHHGHLYIRRYLRPLTPAARAMLALVKP